MEEADDSFEMFKLKRIMYQTDSYSVAFSKLKQAEVASDIQTEEEDAQKTDGKRIRKQPVRYDSDSTPDKSISRKRKGEKTTTEQTPPPKTSRRSLPSLPPLPQTPSILELQPNRVNDQTPLTQPSTSGHKQPRRCLQEMQSDHSTPRSVSAIEKKMLSLLEEVKSQVSHNTKLLNHVIKKTEQNEKDGSNNADLPEGVALPICSTEQFQVVEQRLDNEATVKKLTTHLGTIGGDNVADCTRRILKYVLSHELALTFSWKGQGNKTGFSPTRLSSVIQNAVRKNRLTATASDKDIGIIIRDWLRYAKDREGGRKQREQRKKDAENATAAAERARNDENVL